MKDKYIFLDTFIFSNILPKPDLNQRLSNFIKKHNLIIILDAILFAELYFLTKENNFSVKQVRLELLNDFLYKMNWVLLDPTELFKSERKAWDKQSFKIDLPIQSFKSSLSPELQKKLLSLLFNRDPLLIKKDKDIEKMARIVMSYKDTWLKEKDKIIEEAINNPNKRWLKSIDNGRYGVSGNNKQEMELNRLFFLYSLDMKWVLDPNDEQGDADRLMAVMKKTRNGLLAYYNYFRATHLTSLAFFYQYVEYPPSQKPAFKSSDLADFLQLSFIPYCRYFTLDKNMELLVKRILESGYNKRTCEILTERDLLTLI